MAVAMMIVSLRIRVSGAGRSPNRTPVAFPRRSRMAGMQKMMVALAALFLSVTAGASDVISLEVLPCGTPGEAGGLAAGSDLARMKIDTRRYPDAICNDGSPAVYYVRPYTREESRDKWLIMLQGGGSCRDGQSCAERWCSAGTNFGMDKMTTTLSKPMIRGGGILSPDASNDFGSWNAVLVYYCSSDGWAGRRSDLEYVATGGSATVNFRMHFRGADVVDAVFDTLRHPARTRGVRLGGNPAVLPDLDEATDVLFVGASGGGAGVKTNADRIGELLRATNVACQAGGCPLVYKAVIDSHFTPAYEQLDFSKTTLCAANAALCTYEGFFRSERESLAAARNEFVDASCVDYHQRIEPGTEWKCADASHVIRNHVTTPMLVGQDLQDQLISGNFVEAGFGTLSDFGDGVESQLQALATLDATAEEGSARTGVPIARPGAWGPQCRGHELLGSSDDFFRTPISVDGAARSYHDIVSSWYSGGTPVEAIRDFTTPGAVPGCP